MPNITHRTLHTAYHTHDLHRSSVICSLFFDVLWEYDRFETFPFLVRGVLLELGGDEPGAERGAGTHAALEEKLYKCPQCDGVRSQ